jgi:hypothetical protein
MIRPRLRPGAYFVPTADGVCFSLTGRTEAFTGATIYAWIEKLAPYLDGRSTLDELTGSLDSGKAAMVEKIIAALASRGLVTDAADDLPHTLSPAEMDRYADQIAFIGELTDSGPHRFQRWRTCRTVAVGSGRTLAALITMLMDSGLSDLTAIVTPEGERRTDFERLGAIRREPDQRLRVHDWPIDQAGLRTFCADAQLLVHVSDHLMAGRALTLDRLCRNLGVPVVHGLVTGEEAWVGPVSAITAEGQGWESGWRRLADRQAPGAAGSDERAPGDADLLADHRAGPISPNLAGAAASLVGALAGVIAFRHVTGIDTQAGRLTHVDLATLGTAEHRFAPHPRATRRGRAAPAVAKAAEDLFDERVPELIDPRLGPLSEVGERAFAQLPLNVAAAMMHPPRRQPRLVTGVGPTFRAARIRAARRALELYSWLNARAVNAENTDPVGLASGTTWEAATRDALIALCHDLTIRAMTAAAVAYPRLRPERELLGEPGRAYLRWLELVGVDFSVYDVTGPLGVPACAICRGQRTVAYVSGASRAAAITGALEAVLADHQARSNRQWEYAPEAVPDLPTRLRGGPGNDPGEPDGVLSAADLRARLATAGLRPRAVPLDEDPAVYEVLGHIVQMTLHHV